MGGHRLSPAMAVAFAALAGTQAAAQVAPPAVRPVAKGAPAPTAQPAAPGNAVEQIVVTANKRRERARDVANSVTAISGTQLDRRQEVSVQDLVSQVPGLSVEADDKTTVRIIIRGLNTGSPGATVASLLDDTPTNSVGAQNDASTNTPNFDTYDLSRIEVLRGPQGSLYGASAEGGLIKYVTNPPDPTKYSGELEGGLDGTTDGGLGGSIKGFANLPLLDGKAALRITGWNEWIPGFIDNPDRDKTDANSGQRYGWRASLLVQPTPDLTVRLTAERQTLFSNGTDFLQARGAALTPTSPPGDQLSLVNGLVNNTYLPTQGQNESGVYYGNVNYDLGWSNLTSITSFTDNSFRSLIDATNDLAGPGLTYGNFFSADVYGVPSLAQIRQNSSFDKFNQEVRLTSDPGFAVLGRRFEWLVGGYYTHETSVLSQDLDGLAASTTRLIYPAGERVRIFGQLSEWAFFANADYYILPNVDLALGGRLSGNAQHSQEEYLPAALTGPSTLFLSTLKSNDHDQLFSVAPRWHINDDSLLYARIASGYRPGGPNVALPGVTGIPTSYSPDRTVNYELGFRQDLFNKAVSIDVTGFFITWKDIQVLSTVVTSDGPFGVNGNAGSAVSKGVEWNLSWVPLPGLKLNATGSYQDARLTQDAFGLGGANGDYLPYVPNVSSAVNVDYGWALTDRFRAYVSGTWSYVGERYTGFSPATTPIVSHVLLPGYNTGALRTGVEDDRYSFELYINNISDSRGITYYQSEGGQNFTGQETIIQPRTIGAIARVKF